MRAESEKCVPLWIKQYLGFNLHTISVINWFNFELKETKALIKLTPPFALEEREGWFTEMVGGLSSFWKLIHAKKDCYEYCFVFIVERNKNAKKTIERVSIVIQMQLRMAEVFRVFWEQEYVIDFSGTFFSSKFYPNSCKNPHFPTVRDYPHNIRDSDHHFLRVTQHFHMFFDLFQHFIQIVFSSHMFLPNLA